MVIFSKIPTFFKEVRLEMKKVTWPSRQETIKHTMAVVAISLLVAAFLGAADLLFTWVLDRFVL